jgi:apolipoprotein N-acyltransferase
VAAAITQYQRRHHGGPGRPDRHAGNRHRHAAAAVAADYLPTIAEFLKSTGSNLILGIPVADSQTAYFNSVIGIPASGRQLLPLRQAPSGAVRRIHPARLPLVRRPDGHPARRPDQRRRHPARHSRSDQRVLPNICYEDLFGEEIAAQLHQPAAGQKPATMLLNVSNLAWFGDTIAIPQHLQISQMRTLETGRPMLRATNTGATAVINGRAGGAATAGQPDRHAGRQVQGMAGQHPYILWGNKPVAAADRRVAGSGMVLVAAHKKGAKSRLTLQASKTR